MFPAFTLYAQSGSNPTANSLLQAFQAGELGEKQLAKELLNGAVRSPNFTADVQGIQGQIPRLNEIMGPELVAKTRDLLASGAFAEAENLRIFARQVFKSDSPFPKLVDSLVQGADKLKKALASSAPKDLAEALQDSSLHGEQEIVSARLLDFVKKYGTRVPPDGNEFQLLQKLAIVQPVLNAPDALSAAQVILSGIVQKLDLGTLSLDAWTLDDPEVENFLKSVITWHPDMLPMLLKLYSAEAIDRISQNDSETSRHCVDWVTGWRREHTEENNQLKRNIAIAAQGPGSEAYAQTLVMELQTNGALGKVDQFRFAVKGYFGNVIRFGLLAAVMLLGGVLAYFLIRPLIFVLFIPKKVGEEAKKIRHWRRRKKGIRYDAPTTTDDEYTELLRAFGLGDDATESQIKHAYREAMKRYHPDTMAKEGITMTPEETDQAFRDLKKIHDRIIQIRSSWFGGAKRG